MCDETLFSQRHVANSVCQLVRSARIIEAIMIYVLGFNMPCLAGCSAECFMILSPQMFSKPLLAWSVRLQEVLVCSFLNRLRLYSDLPLLRPPEKGLQAKILIH